MIHRNKNIAILIVLSFFTITPVCLEITHRYKVKKEKVKPTYLYKETIEGIKHFEGFKKNAYICPGGVLTIGYGQTGGILMSDTISEEQASKHLIKEFKRCLKIAEADGLKGNESLAIASFIYNLGETKYHNSTLRKYLKKGKSIDSKILEYRCSGGKVLKGLEKRRAWELELFKIT